MKTFIFVTDIFFVIASIILFIFLFYYGVTNNFSITVIVSIIVTLFMAFHSAIELIKLRKECY